MSSHLLGSEVACVPHHGSIWRRLGPGAARGFWLRLPELHLVSRSRVPIYSLGNVVPRLQAIQSIFCWDQRRREMGKGLDQARLPLEH